MNDADRQLMSIFGEALDCASPEEQRAYLERACGDDGVLRGQVEAILRAHQQAGDFLRGADSPAVGETADQSLREGPGMVIGPYKLLEQIGEGGMGTVWMAQQTEPVKRVVAIKLIKAGMDSKQVIARFEAERQALALMDHPNIAKVLDAGTTNPKSQAPRTKQISKPKPEIQNHASDIGASDLGFLCDLALGSWDLPPGRPYFVMELVKGMPITKYCDEHRLTPRQRLELFIPVCQAVQHAHQKGIIHRDLKPSNVLVALYDGKPVPKVIDFGVAKATGQPLTEKTLVTGFGNIVGTLEYMSPEQAEINQLDIDTRSDIYSLGVLLYELLTGSPPFSRKDMEALGLLETLRLIREQEPTKPSAKLSTADGLPTLAANRGTEPAKLAKLVRGELDWIVMKALEKERNRRYETANSFAIDVQRYLADEPVQACPPSITYRARKFIQRNRAMVLATTVIAVALIGGAVSAAWGLVSALDAEQKALSDRDAKASALTAEATARRLTDDHRKLAYSALDKIYLKLVEDELPRHPDRLESYRSVLEEALKFYVALAESGGKDLPATEQLAAAYTRAGAICDLLDENATALKYYELAEAGFALLLDRRPGDARYRSDRAVVLAVLARQHLKLGNVAKAEQLFDESFRAQGADPGTEEFALVNRAETWIYRGELLKHTGRPAEAAKAYAEAATILEGLVKARMTKIHPRHLSQLSRCHTNWGNALLEFEQVKEAELHHRLAVDLARRLADKFPDAASYQDTYAGALQNHSASLSRQHRDIESRKAIGEALQVARQLVRDYPLAPRYRATLVELYVNHTAMTSDAELSRDPKVFETALRLVEETIARAQHVSVYRRDYVGICVNYGAYRYGVNDPAGAEEAFSKGEARARALVEDFPHAPEYRKTLIWLLKNRAQARRDLDQVDLAEKDASEALTHARRLAELFPKSLSYQVELADAHEALGLCLRRRARPKEALQELDAALGILIPLREQHLLSQAGRSELASAHLNHGSIRYDLKDYSGALESFERSEAELRSLIDEAPKAAKYHSRRAHVHINRGDVFKAEKKLDQAETAYRKGIAILDELIGAASAAPEHRFKRLQDTERLFFLVMRQPGDRLPELEPVLKSGIGIGEDLVREHPGMLAYKEVLGTLHNLQTYLLVSRNRFDDAALHVARFTELAEELIKVAPKNPRYREMQEKSWHNVSLVAYATAREPQLLEAAEKSLALKPGAAAAMSWLAWCLATFRDQKLRDAARAVKLAEQALSIARRDMRDKAEIGDYCNTFGIALYRNGQFAQAAAKLHQSLELRPDDRSNVCFNRFYRAMTYWKLGDKKVAQAEYDLAVKAIALLEPKEEQHRAHLTRLRAEAAELLGMPREDKKD